MTSQDPSAFLRAMMGDWIGKGAATPGAGAFRAMIDQALTAANIPTRAEVDALAARVDQLEAALFRAEQGLATKKTKKAK